jgi:hypothetical protein
MTERMITRHADYAVTKTLATVTAGPDDTDDGPGTFSLILSTDAVDRDGEVVESGAFNPLPDHISMDVDHGMSVATTVGSGRPFYNASGQLQVDGTFASTDLGQSTRTLVREGHVRTASVAMIPTVKTKSADGKTQRIVKADLLNGAFTPVPSNTTATILSAKSVEELADMKAGARNSKSDAGDIQQIHDLAAGLGAICGDGSSEGKHIHGSLLADAKALGLTDDQATELATKYFSTDTKAIESPHDSAADAAAQAAADAADETADHDADVKSAAIAALKAALE